MDTLLPANIKQKELKNLCMPMFGSIWVEGPFLDTITTLYTFVIQFKTKLNKTSFIEFRFEL